ncbi:hypothetical protein ACQ4PT_037729 [Festuca glaucescens]
MSCAPPATAACRKDKCVSCFITTGYTRCFVPTSYSRCLALKRVLGSARVAFPNRCSVAKMLYHVKAEHQKTCLAHEIGKKRGTAVMKMGPCGGVGGDFRQTALCNANYVIKLVVINHGDAVDAVTVMLGPEGTGAAGSKCRGEGGKHSEFRLEPGEYLTSVEGHYGQFNGIVVVRSLKFVSNIRTYGSYGKEDGVAFALPAGASGKIVGFHFKCGQFIDAIGTYVKMD